MINQDIIKGDWKQISGALKQRWGKLTDDDLKSAEGRRDVLIGKLQTHYGLARENIELQLKELGYS